MSDIVIRAEGLGKRYLIGHRAKRERYTALRDAERVKMRQLAAALHAGELKGYTGRPMTDIVNIGIGGSDLGQQAAGVAPGPGELGEALTDDVSKRPVERAQATSRIMKPAVKPGPSDVSRWRPVAPAASARSSTNKTVGADMLPYSRNTSRAWTRPPGAKS